MTEKLYTFEKSYELFERAKKHIPGGISNLTRSPYFVTYGSYPVYSERAKGCRFWDIDGNEYIDYMSSFGPNILGMCNDEVDAAVIDQVKKGNAFTIPTMHMTLLAERMVELVEDMDWVTYGKNGSDATAFATSLARLHTGRNVIVKARHAYHGGYYWSVPSDIGIPPEYKAHVAEFEYNDFDDFKRVVGENSGKIAAIIVNPFKHDAMFDQQLPKEGWYRLIEDTCRIEGCLFIMDDIRAGWRLNLRGSHRYFNTKPDIVCFGKAMSNGYAISAVMGKAPLMEEAKSIYFSATYFTAAVPMSAALATLKILERDNVVEHIYEMGSMLKRGICEQAEEFGVSITYSGHVAMPFIRFADDEDFGKARYFCGEAAKRGVFLHPHHNMFINGAHNKEDIEKTLEVTRRCFALLAERM
ncbi:MAG: aspartate aminotransferase family protein [Chloroflexota bacterium]